MTVIAVRVLGTVRVSRGDVDLPVPGARLEGLLVRLALAAGRPVDPGVLVDALWGDEPPSGPVHALQSLVTRLRRALGADGAVELVAGGYRLAVEPGDVDAVRFEQLATAGRDRLRDGDPETAAALLGEAVELWAEPAGPSTVAPAVATRLRRAATDAVADLAEAHLALGRPDVAAAGLTALLDDRPADERAAALLMDSLAAQGRQADALAAFERVRTALADELGADPGAALRRRHADLLRGDPPHEGSPRTELPREEPPHTDRLRGDLPHGAPDAPEPVPSRPAPLPAPVTGFVGRDDDLARIAGLLDAGRLVTVVGPGGAGKTRIAVEAARLRRHRDGVRFVDLAPVVAPGGVGAAVLAALGRRTAGFGARPTGDGELVDRLTGLDVLLVLDNCEHVIDAAAHLTSTVLSRCPGVRVVATSREPLAVDGETLVPLGPLPLPGPDDDVARTRGAASVRLFLQRAAAVRPGFALDTTTLPDVRRVVRGLDGLPLALELAAARLRTLSLPELADGLTDRFRLLTTGSRTAAPRHRTLRAVISWSWDLLAPHERVVADRVAVLPGGVTAAAAVAVCAGAVPAADVPEVLAALVDRSLLVLGAEPGRYRMLETLREYGVERLAGTGDLDAVRDLAADHVAAVVAAADPALRGPGQLAALRVVGAEYDNAVAALRRRCGAGDADGAVALALDLTWYWQMLGRRAEAARWLGEAVDVPGGTPGAGRDCARAIHLFNRVDTAAERVDTAAERVDTAAERRAVDDRGPWRGLAERLAGQPDLPGPHSVLAAGALAFLGHERPALAVLDRLAGGDDAWRAGLALLYRAELAENAGELDTVRPDVDDALARFREVGDRWAEADVLPLRAQLRQYDGDLDGALSDLDAARALTGELGARNPADDVFGDLRRVELHARRGDPDLSVLDGIRDRVRRADRPEMLVLLDAREADLRVQLGDLDRAGELLARAAAEPRGGGRFVDDDHVDTLVDNARARLCVALGDLAGARRALSAAYAAGLRSRDLPMLALVAVSVAGLADALGRHEDSAFLLGAATRLRGSPDRTDLLVRELTARARAAIGDDALAAALARGRASDSAAAVVEVDPARLDRSHEEPSHEEPSHEELSHEEL